MPWRTCKPMDERLKFIARLLEGEKMSALCREFGISRPTGYKIFNHYKDSGLQGLEDRSRRPYRHANKLPFQVERAILQIKREYDDWGAPKIREKLIKLYPVIRPPAKSTIHAVLDRHGLVKRRNRRRYRARGTALKESHRPNGLWCADYKGEFMLGSRFLYSDCPEIYGLTSVPKSRFHNDEASILTIPDRESTLTETCAEFALVR